MALQRFEPSQVRRPVILVFSAFYLPGHKGGGAPRSVANLVELLGDEFDFRVVTGDRDFGDAVPFSRIRVNEWQTVGKATVFYASPGLARWWHVARIMRAGGYDMLYLNSFFSRAFSILPYGLWKVRFVKRVPLLLAPRGEFSPGALGIKSLRKRAYLRLVKLLRLYVLVVFHASTEQERADIQSTLLGTRRFRIAPALTSSNMVVASDVGTLGRINSELSRPEKRRKAIKELKIGFLSRIARIKNLDGALRILTGLQGKVVFNIYGPAEDKAYWIECQRLIAELPVNVQVKYWGELKYDQVLPALQQQHLFFLPTRGESFGHVILEALTAGCPVLISDQTPWRQLKEQGVGWDVPLDQPAAFQRIIQECIDMDAEMFEKLSARAAHFGGQIAANPQALEQSRRMFRKILAISATKPKAL